ncbi:GPP34 family phosphoprotein [Streptomyces sp. NPDC001941]|uniref:GOLPH3/VPS74 family protein n=1 Tax=Streptomyces sp. NPDC001941 TaxID=3154659 RepID=UPI0033165CB2
MRNDTTRDDLPSEPLIVEDLTLLMMDDASGAVAGAGTLFYTQGGAVLADLALGGHVEVDERDKGLTGLRVHAVAGRPPADPLLRDAYDKAAEKPRGVQTLLASAGPLLREPVLDRLAERGVITRERRKALGLFPTTAVRVADTGRKAALVERVRAVLVDGAEPDARTAALIGLLSASGTLVSLHRSVPWTGPVVKRAKEIERGDWGAEAVSAAVLRTTAAVAASSAAAVAASVTAATS